MIMFAMLAVVAFNPPQATATDAAGQSLPSAPVAVTPAPVLSQDGFQAGVDTFSTVVAKLGKPNSTSMMSDGTKIVVYMSNHAHVKGTSFIPVVGLFASGAKGSMSIKSFTFGPDGVLKSFTSTDSNVNCNVGIAGGGCH